MPSPVRKQRGLHVELDLCARNEPIDGGFDFASSASCGPSAVSAPRSSMGSSSPLPSPAVVSASASTPLPRMRSQSNTNSHLRKRSQSDASDCDCSPSPKVARSSPHLGPTSTASSSRTRPSPRPGPGPGPSPRPASIPEGHAMPAKAFKLLGVSEGLVRRTQQLRDEGLEVKYITSTRQTEPPSPPSVVLPPLLRRSSSQPDPDTHTHTHMERENDRSDGAADHARTGTFSNLSSASTSSSQFRRRVLYRPGATAEPAQKAAAFKQLVARTLEKRGFTVEQTLAERADPACPSRAFSHAVTLQDLLESDLGTEVFMEFLKTEFAEENLLFYQAVEEYRQRPTIKAAQELHDGFTRQGAPREVNISYQIRDSIASTLAELQVKDTEQDHALATLFNEAQKCVYRLMERDTFPRFRQSVQWLNYGLSFRM